MKGAAVGMVAAVLVLAPGAPGAAEQEASIDWVRRVDLSTPVSGVVRDVLVGAGDRVQRGQVLVRLNPRPFRARVAAARAQSERRAEALKEAQRERDRTRELYDRTLLSDHELQVAEIALVTADAQHREALAALELVTVDLENSVVKAPFDGVVVARHVEQGQTVVTRLQAVPLVSVVETGRYLARGRLALDQLEEIAVGQVAGVTAAGRRYVGRVVRIGFEPVGGDARQPLFAVDVEFTTEADVLYRAGQAAVVEWP